MKKDCQIEIELNELFDGRLKIYQKKNGYRFSIDAILLADFTIRTASGAIADLGTGSGVLPVLLARHKKFTKIAGVEIQEELALLAEKNISLNGCGDVVSIVHADIKTIKNHFSPESFDTVITNPPFYPVTSGRINPDTQKAAARHEIYGTLGDFIAGAAFLLKQGGRFIAVYIAARTADLIEGMRRKNIEPKTLRFIHPRAKGPATMVLVEGIRGAGTELKILEPVFVYNADGTYSHTIKALFENI